MISLPEKDDLDQESAIAAWLAEKSFDGRGDIEGWKAFKAKRARMDYARKWMHTRKRTGRCQEMPAQIGITNAPAIEPWLLIAIASLSRESQQILRLRYWEGYTPTQIGNMIGVPAAVIDRKLRAAKMILRRELGTKKPR